MGVLHEFLSYLEEQPDNRSIYVFGAQGQGEGVISENWIRRMETSRNNADRAIALWKRRKAEGKTALRAPERDVQPDFPSEVIAGRLCIPGIYQRSEQGKSLPCGRSGGCREECHRSKRPG